MFSLAAIIKPVFRKMPVQILKTFIAAVLMMVLPSKMFAQQTFPVDSDTFEHLFGQKEIKLLEDKKGTLSLQQVMSPGYEKKFEF